MLWNKFLAPPIHLSIWQYWLLSLRIKFHSIHSERFTGLVKKYMTFFWPLLMFLGNFVANLWLVLDTSRSSRSFHSIWQAQHMSEVIFNPSTSPKNGMKFGFSPNCKIFVTCKNTFYGFELGSTIQVWWFWA